MNRLFSKRYPRLADYFSAPLVRESDPNAPTPLSPEEVLRLTWRHRADLVRILKVLAPLRAVAYGWRQEALAKNAQEVADLGNQLYEHIARLAEHWSEIGNRLNKAVDAYNSSVATLESRVLVSARRFRELEAASEGIEIEVAAPVDHTARAMQAVELSVPGLQFPGEGNL